MCNSGNLEALKLFLENGCDVNTRFKHKKNITMMDIAALNGNLSMMKLLIEYNFDMTKNVQNDNDTIFLSLCQHQNIEYLQWFTNTFKNYNAKKQDYNNMIQSKTTDDLHNALHLASLHANFELLKFLLENVYFPNDNLSNEIGDNVVKETDRYCNTHLHLLFNNVYNRDESNIL